MKGEKIIHIKFEYDAGVQSKKDILSTEINLLRINQILKKFSEYRQNELDTKIDLERKLRALKLDIGRLQNLLPEVKIPQILEKAHKKIIAERKAGKTTKPTMVEEIKVKEKIKPSPKDTLESELEEIQKRLSALAG